MTLILFGTLAIVMLVLLPAIARTAAMGAAILLAASLIDAWMIEPPYVELGVQIYLHDLIFILLALVGVQRLLMRAGLGLCPWAGICLAYCCLARFSLGFRSTEQQLVSIFVTSSISLPEQSIFSLFPMTRASCER